MIMASLYLKLGWPEYQEYQQYDDFDEHACYSPENECYFIEQDWLINKGKENNGASLDPITTLHYKDYEIKLSSRFVGYGLPDWEKKKSNKHPHFLVKFEIGCNSHTFDYWGSVMDYRNDIDSMTEKNCIEAFEMFIFDCVSANQSIDDFQSEFGYENVSECIKIYNACKESLEAWKNFFIDPYDLDNWLRDTYDL